MFFYKNLQLNIKGEPIIFNISLYKKNNLSAIFEDYFNRVKEELFPTEREMLDHGYKLYFEISNVEFI